MRCRAGQKGNFRVRPARDLEKINNPPVLVLEFFDYDYEGENEMMKKQFNTLAALLVLPLLLAAGCASNDEPVVFYSTPKIPSFASGATAKTKGLSKDDEMKIQTVVYGYLLDRHFWEGGDYSAIFLQADDSVVDAFIKKFPDHVPPIKPSSHVDLRSNQSPLDKDTGKPVMILGADVGELNADGSVDVIGRWFAGGAVKGSYTFLVKETDGEWSIASVK